MQAIRLYSIKIGLNSQDLILHAVQVVPKLRTNLLSLSRLIENGFDVKFFKNNCTISKDGKIITGIRKSNMYMLLEDYVCKDQVINYIQDELSSLSIQNNNLETTPTYQNQKEVT